MAGPSPGFIVKVAERAILTAASPLLTTTLIRRGTGPAAVQVIAAPSSTVTAMMIFLEVSSDRLSWSRVAQLDLAIAQCTLLPTTSFIPPSRFIRFGAVMTSGAPTDSWAVTAWVLPG